MTGHAVLAEKNWQARLALDFSGRQDKTIIARREHVGPLVIQKPFYPEGEVCHVYLLHPPGGVVGGDQLSLDVAVNNAGHGLITTPAAGKFYRSDGRRAGLLQTLRVEPGSTLEWLPQETILFSACRLDMKTLVHLQPGANFIGWEILCLGRPACGERFDRGEARQAFEIWRDDKPLLLERTGIAGDDEVLSAAWGLQNYTVTGSLLAVNADNAMLQSVRDDPPVLNGLFSVTLIEDVLVCRVLCHQGEDARQALIHVWKILRPLLLHRPACAPRIWST
jgi:urease accessory protein